MAAQSYLAFPATKVWESCMDALCQIERDREALLDALAQERRWIRIRGQKIVPLPLAVGHARLTTVDHDIAERHEADEENQMLRLLGLASDAVEYGMDKSIILGIDDHAIMSRLACRYRTGRVSI